MLSFVIPLLAVMQIGARSAADTTPPDSARAHADSVRENADSVRHALLRARRRIPLTPELLATAYRDPGARDLIAHARAARLRQDSSLLSYDAMTHQRISAWLGVRHIGVRRLVYRSENASRVRWARGAGAWVDVVGSRTAIPMAFKGARVLRDALDESPIPYYPGREQLLTLAGMETVTGQDDGLFVHPLAAGAEAYYQYASGDSVEITLPDGRTVRLRDVTITARRPRWDLLVGSLWFDAATAHLVRAVFRPSAPFNVMDFLKDEEPDDYDDIPRVVRAAMTPMELTVEAFTVEYGLHEQRWWLPRFQTVTARARVGFMRMPFTAEQTFDYASVNGTDSLPPVPVSSADSGSRAHRDADAVVHTDSARRAAERDDHGAPRRHDDDDTDELQCTPGDTLLFTRSRFDGQLHVAYRVPCDTVALKHSPELPPSIYDPGEDLFDTREQEQLTKELSLSLQPGWGRQPPTVHYGLGRGLLRYNRVEGLSAGVSVEQQFGRGFVGEAMARLGSADLEPNGALSVHRGNGRTTYALGVYRRLDAASDWGDPFGVGASLNALLFGRDDGFYYRSWGAELTRATERGSSAQTSWRLFAERQSRAVVETQFSLANAINDVRFRPNITATNATVAGVAATFRHSYGLDPRGWRGATVVRAELGTGTFDYARGSAELTVSRAFGARLAGAITGSAGTSGGTLPVQRRWFLGGPHTIHGQDPGAAVGDAYWFARAELGTSASTIRPVIFGDLGWAGDRHDWRHPGRPISGAGVGASVMDGLIRLDLARGIQPDHGWRADLYLQASF
jgi:hypothetical protein